MGKTGNWYIWFDSNTCQRCVFFDRCVRYQSQSQTKRRLVIRPFYPYMRERRMAQEQQWFRDEMRVRAQIEGTISEGTRCCGLRNARYHGKSGHQFQFYQTGAAINVKRIVRAILKEANTDN